MKHRPNKGLPLPDFDRPVPSQDEFTAWCEHPVTRFVAAAYQFGAQKQRNAWDELSWDKGSADQNILTELRTRADAYMAFLETGLNDYAKLFEE